MKLIWTVGNPDGHMKNVVSGTQDTGGSSIGKTKAYLVYQDYEWTIVFPQILNYDKKASLASLKKQIEESLG